jgi:hypothetical protein
MYKTKFYFIKCSLIILYYIKLIYSHKILFFCIHRIHFTALNIIILLSEFFFIYQLMHKKIALKGILKFTLKQL